MKTSAVEIWVWVLIYGGLLLFCLGLFIDRNDFELGWLVGLTGAALVLAGVLLIVIRSRMRD